MWCLYPITTNIIIVGPKQYGGVPAIRGPFKRSDRSVRIGHHRQSPARPPRITHTELVYPVRHGVIERNNEKVRFATTNIKVQR